jgi:hypothetical protein
MPGTQKAGSLLTLPKNNPTEKVAMVFDKSKHL